MLLARDYGCYVNFIWKRALVDTQIQANICTFFQITYFAKNEFISIPSSDFSWELAQKEAIFLGVRRDQFNCLFSWQKHKKITWSGSETIMIIIYALQWYRGNKIYTLQFLID